jgi:hypothetical protein
MKMTRKEGLRIADGKEGITRDTMSALVIPALIAPIIPGKATRETRTARVAVSEVIMDSPAIATMVAGNRKAAVVVWTGPAVDGPEASRAREVTASRIRIGGLADPRVTGIVVHREDLRDMETWATRAMATRADMATRVVSAELSRITVRRDMVLLRVVMISPRDTATREDGVDHPTRVTVDHREIMVHPSRDRDTETREDGAERPTRADTAALKEDTEDHRVVDMVLREDMITREDGAHQTGGSKVQREDMADPRIPVTWDIMGTRDGDRLTGEVSTREAVDHMETTAACSVSIPGRTWMKNKPVLPDGGAAARELQPLHASAVQPQALQTAQPVQGKKAVVQNNINS